MTDEVIETEGEEVVRPRDFPDGIYFHMDDEEYFAAKRLGSGDIRRLNISPATYWSKSHFNTDSRDKRTGATNRGKLFHTAILEPELVAKRFAQAPMKEEHDGPKNDNEVCDALGEMGQTKRAKGENALDRAERLASLGGPRAWVIEEAAFQERLGGRIAIDSATWDEVMRDADSLTDNPELVELVAGGFAEVSLFWTDEESGVPMKARIDKLKSGLLIDLKSFTNPQEKELERMLTERLAYSEYVVQARHYQRGLGWFHEKKLGDFVTDASNDAEESFVALVCRTVIDVWRPVILFHEMGGVPNVAARELEFYRPAPGMAEQASDETEEFYMTRSAMTARADRKIRTATVAYQKALELYGPYARWYPFDMLRKVTDDDFKPWYFDE